jgi:hypothetical protein
MAERFHAYELVSPDSYDLGVEKSAPDLTKRLADDLKILVADEQPVLRVRIGMVEAGSVDEAMDQVRNANWLPERVQRAELLKAGWR